MFDELAIRMNLCLIHVWIRASIARMICFVVVKDHLEFSQRVLFGMSICELVGCMLGFDVGSKHEKSN